MANNDATWLIIFLVAVVLYLNNNEIEQLNINQGDISGISLESRNGTKYRAFLGIPYAKPPIGKLRFAPPQPPDSWEGVRNASELPPTCPQKPNYLKIGLPDTIYGQEDCLYLSVYTPQVGGAQIFIATKNTNPNLPVMVWIHGGGFTEGSSSMFKPDYFMDHPIVLVHINYRLGSLGFLSTGDEALPGNIGMKDQVAALKWVQKNIASFGGDPNKVTIFGVSAGAACVHYHLYSPLSQGLFHRAISQSGTALANWAYTAPEKAKERALKFGELTNCPTSSSTALVDCLRELSVDELVLAYEKIRTQSFSSAIPFAIVPELPNENAFITENPWHQQVQSNVPWILGINSADGGVFANPFLSEEGALQSLNKIYTSLFPDWYNHYDELNDENEISEITEKVKRFYFENENIGQEDYMNLVHLFTDILFTYNSIESVHRYDGPVYFYYYDHRNKETFHKFLGTFSEELGVCHGDELISLFYLPPLFPKVIEGDDYEISKSLINYWVNFAYHGNPNNPDEEITWKPVQSQNIEYLNIKIKGIQMKSDLLKNRYSFWKNLGILTPSQTSKKFFTDEL